MIVFIDRDTSLNAPVVRLEFVLDGLLVFGCMSSNEGHWLSLIRDGIGSNFGWLIPRMHLALVVCVYRSLRSEICQQIHPAPGNRSETAFSH